MTHKDNNLLYWKEAKAEFIVMMNAAAIGAMESPIMQGKKLDGTAMSTSEVTAYNSLVATNNEGIRDFLTRFIGQLMQEGEADGGGT